MRVSFEIPPCLRAPLIVAVAALPFLPYYWRSVGAPEGSTGSGYAGPLWGVRLFVVTALLVWVFYRLRVGGPEDRRGVSRRVRLSASWLLLLPLAFYATRTDSSLLGDGSLLKVEYGFGCPGFSWCLYFSAILLSAALQRLMLANRAVGNVDWPRGCPKSGKDAHGAR